jgi:hypothetical protein
VLGVGLSWCCEFITVFSSFLSAVEGGWVDAVLLGSQDGSLELEGERKEFFGGRMLILGSSILRLGRCIGGYWDRGGRLIIRFMLRCVVQRGCRRPGIRLGVIVWWRIRWGRCWERPRRGRRLCEWSFLLSVMCLGLCFVG